MPIDVPPAPNDTAPEVTCEVKIQCEQLIPVVLVWIHQSHSGAHNMLVLMECNNFTKKYSNHSNKEIFSSNVWISCFIKYSLPVKATFFVLSSHIIHIVMTQKIKLTVIYRSNRRSLLRNPVWRWLTTQCWSVVDERASQSFQPRCSIYDAPSRRPTGLQLLRAASWIQLDGTGSVRLLWVC